MSSSRLKIPQKQGSLRRESSQQAPQKKSGSEWFQLNAHEPHLLRLFFNLALLGFSFESPWANYRDVSRGHPGHGGSVRELPPTKCPCKFRFRNRELQVICSDTPRQSSNHPQRIKPTQLFHEHKGWRWEKWTDRNRRWDVTALVEAFFFWSRGMGWFFRTKKAN